MCVCVTVVLADVSCRLIDVQAATYVWRISCSVHLLGDDQCVDVMNKKLIIDVFGALHLFLSCCTALLVKGAACQSESYMYDYIYEGKRNFGPFTCLVHCVTHGALCSIPQVFCPSHRHTGHHPAKMYTEQEILQTHPLCSCLNIIQSGFIISNHKLMI